MGRADGPFGNVNIGAVMNDQGDDDGIVLTEARSARGVHGLLPSAFALAALVMLFYVMTLVKGPGDSDPTDLNELLEPMTARSRNPTRSPRADP